MPLACDLELDANGEETFFVDREVISKFSARLSMICQKSHRTEPPKLLKVILPDFPGGAVILDRILRFCYNEGKLVEMTPANACLLNFSAHFMEMTTDFSSSPNLVEQTEQFLKGIPYWTWSELLVALRQSQDYKQLASISSIIDKLSDSIASRIILTSEASPPCSSPESSGCRVSFETRSTLSTKSCSQRPWWFDDLMPFQSDVIEKVVKHMISAKLEHKSISRFLLYYLKTTSAHCTSAEKKLILKLVIDLLYCLDRGCVSSRGLFWILRLSLPLNLDDSLVGKLDSMIGCQIDQATLDSILVPSSIAAGSLYDVNLILRFLKSFVGCGGGSSASRLRRVGRLMDLYLMEVAPDPHLKVQNFISLITALPDSARESHDGLYQAIDMYIQVHSGLSEEKKMRITSVLNYDKLSSESCKHLAQNSKLPSRTAIQALITQQCKLKNLLQDTNSNMSLHDSPCKDYLHDEQIILYSRRLELKTAENEKLKLHLQGMNSRVVELEKKCKKMQSQVAMVIKGGRSCTRSIRSLPKLCK